MNPYDPNIPQDLPPGNVAVDSIRNNFLQYAAVFDNNHMALNAQQQGKHSNVVFQEQSIDPDVEGSFDSLYGKSVTSTLNTSQQIFSRLPQFLTEDKPNEPIQMTFNVVNTSGPQYQSFLAGGYIIYFGSIPSANSINTQITLVPTPSEILCVIPNPTRLVALSSIGPDAPLRISVTVDNASQFTVKASNLIAPAGTGVINWVAVAKQ